jgi:hypothetical protein
MTFEQQKNVKALIWTAGIHLLLLLCFLLLKYTMPAQVPVAELGMEVNLGTTPDGYGDDQPELTEAPAAVALNKQTAGGISSAKASEIHTSDDEEAPAVRVNRNTQARQNTEREQPDRRRNRNREQRNTATATRNQPAPSARYVYPGSTGTGGNSAANNRPGTNEGIGQGDGDMGAPGGTTGAGNYEGTPGGGTSIGHSISGRSLVSRPDPKAEFREGGKVVIRVTVNREGEIISSWVVSAANATIRSLALAKLKNVKFNKSATAPAEQFGNITFDFRTTRK